MEKRLADVEREKQALTKQIQDLKHKNTRLESEIEKQELVEENASLVEKLKKRGRRRRERQNQRMKTSAPAKKNAWATNSKAPSGKKDSAKQQSNDPPSLASEGMSLCLVSSNADVSLSPAPSNDAHVPSADSPQFMYQQQQPPPPPFGYYNMPPVSDPYAQADCGMPDPPYAYPMYCPSYGYNESPSHQQFYGGTQGNGNADEFAQHCGQFGASAAYYE